MLARSRLKSNAMSTSPPPEPVARENDFWPRLGAAIATTGLAVLLWCSGTFWQGMLALGNCSADDTREACAPDRLEVSSWAPVWGSAIGLAVAVVGCWIWPRRPVWLLVGYVFAFFGFAIGYPT